MSIQEKAFGGGIDRMPDISFKIMSFIFMLRDLLTTFDKKLDSFGIKEGDIVVDYGCGPGSYLLRASELAGRSGKVFAADIHELAVKSVEKRVKVNKLKNVQGIQIENYSCPIPDKTADLIYALDMFHMVKEPDRFLKELHRILKKNGRLIIDDGHQTRKQTISKIEKTGIWKIVENRKGWIAAVPD